MTMLATLQSLSPLQLAIVASAASAGVGSGMMYVFSTGVMQGLGQLADAEAVRAMQAINVAVINPLFLGVFLGTGVFIAVLAAVSWFSGGFNPWLATSAVIYLGGVVAVTVLGNVPLNDGLAALDPTALPAGAWDAYARPWLFWNHVRAGMAALAAALLVVAATA